MFNLKDVLPIIEKYPEFTLTDKGLYSVVCYNVMKPETFAENNDDTLCIRLNLRGTCFLNETGEIIRLPFEKFFNVNQIYSTQADVLDKNTDIINVTNKLDGTMICPLIVQNEIFWGTKRCSQDFHDFIINSGIITPELKTFVKEMIADNKSPIFEYHDPKNEGTCIVMRYSKRFIKLLAVRDNKTGEYVKYAPSHLEAKYNIAVNEIQPIIYNSIREAIQDIQTEENCEGYVFELSDGTRVKLKTFWYCSHHRLIDFFCTPWMMRLLIAKYLQINSDKLCAKVNDILMWNPEFDDNGDDIIANMSQEQHDSFEDELVRVGNSLARNASALTQKRWLFQTKKDMGLAGDFVGRNEIFRCFDCIENIRNVLIDDMVNKHFVSNRNCTRWDEKY